MRKSYLEISHPDFGGKRLPVLTHDFSPAGTHSSGRIPVFGKSGAFKDDFIVPTSPGAVAPSPTEVLVVRTGGDDVSMTFFAFISSGKSLGKVVLTDYQVVNGKEVLFMTITMEGTVVEHYNTSENYDAGTLADYVGFRSRQLRYKIE